MLEVCPRIRWMRDPTRGGLASALNELAAASDVGVVLDETAMPLRDAVSLIRGKKAGDALNRQSPVVVPHPSRSPLRRALRGEEESNAWSRSVAGLDALDFAGLLGGFGGHADS